MNVPTSHNTQPRIPEGKMACFFPELQHIIIPLSASEKSFGCILPSQIGLHHERLNDLVAPNMSVVMTPLLRFHLLTSLLNAFADWNTKKKKEMR